MSSERAGSPAQAMRLPPAACIGAIAWPSFFAAGVATMVFFAIVDPVELAAMTCPSASISREAGYTIGFFMFWACTFSSSLFTALLCRPPDDEPPPAQTES